MFEPFLRLCICCVVVSPANTSKHARVRAGGLQSEVMVNGLMFDLCSRRFNFLSLRRLIAISSAEWRALTNSAITIELIFSTSASNGTRSMSDYSKPVSLISPTIGPALSDYRFGLLEDMLEDITGSLRLLRTDDAAVARMNDDTGTFLCFTGWEHLVCMQ